MAPSRSRKRKAPPSSSSNLDVPDNEQENEQEKANRLQRESEVWDAFREEYFEVFEQLPLTLHRQFRLVHELDVQSEAYKADLHSAVRKYIQLRKNLQGTAASNGDAVVTEISSNPIPIPTPATILALAKASSQPFPMTPVRKFQAEALNTPRTPTPLGLAPIRTIVPQTGAEMLSQIGSLCEELTRAAEEKLNLAQAAHDSVDRQIRIIDQAIKEQELAISFGSVPGSHALPELVLPRSRQPPPLAPPPEPVVEEEVIIQVTEEDQPAQRKGKRATNKKQSVKITLPATGKETAPKEEQFCFCRGGNVGDMIACDNPECKIEWFHWECVGVKATPRGKWFCPACTNTSTRPRRRR